MDQKINWIFIINKYPKIKLDQKIKANSACIHPSPTPFREGAHRKKVMSGFKKVSAE